MNWILHMMFMIRATGLMSARHHGVLSGFLSVQMQMQTIMCLTRSLCYMGADLILSPSSWAVPPEHDNLKDPYGDTWRKAYMPVAKEFGVWIASASNVGPVTEGPWKNWNCIGCSLVVAPDGVEATDGALWKNCREDYLLQY